MSMAFVLSDRARETLASAPNTGNITTAGATPGAQSLASVLTSNGDTTWATLTNGTAWETNTLTRVSAGVYSRGTPFASSNAGALVNLTTVPVEVFIDFPASKVGALANIIASGTAIAPPTNDATALGTGALAFSDGFWASGAVQNYNNGDYTVTHSAGRLTYSGASTFTGSVTLSAALIYGGVTLSNAVTGTGNMVLSAAPTISGLLTLSGGQIAFPASQSASAGANTLDDYEEGTYTPTVTAGVGTITSYTSSGAYTKIGNVVHWEADFTLTNAGSAATNLVVTLPFTVSAVRCSFPGREIGVTGFSVAGRTTASAASCDFQKYDGTFIGSTNHRFVISGHYHV